MGPNLHFIPVVDYDSPAMTLIDTWAHSRLPYNLPPKEADELALETTGDLRRLFLNGEASPFEVDPNGSNLLQVSHNVHTNAEDTISVKS